MSLYFGIYRPFVQLLPLTSLPALLIPHSSLILGSLKCLQLNKGVVVISNHHCLSAYSLCKTPLFSPAFSLFNCFPETQLRLGFQDAAIYSISPLPHAHTHSNVVFVLHCPGITGVFIFLFRSFKNGFHSFILLEDVAYVLILDSHFLSQYPMFSRCYKILIEASDVNQQIKRLVSFIIDLQETFRNCSRCYISCC